MSNSGVIEVPPFTTPSSVSCIVSTTKSPRVVYDSLEFIRCLLSMSRFEVS